MLRFGVFCQRRFASTTGASTSSSSLNSTLYIRKSFKNRTAIAFVDGDFLSPSQVSSIVKRFGFREVAQTVVRQPSGAVFTNADVVVTDGVPTYMRLEHEARKALDSQGLVLKDVIYVCSVSQRELYEKHVAFAVPFLDSEKIIVATECILFRTQSWETLFRGWWVPEHLQAETFALFPISPYIKMFRWTIRTFQAAVIAFSAYGEIGNVSRGKIEMMRKAPKDDWIACEKVHGSNFGIYMLVDASGKPRYSYSKRTGMLRPDEDFFGFQCLGPELEKHISQARERLGEILGMTVSGVLLNGEIFGGKYKHPQVPPSKQIARVGNRDRPIQPPQKDDFPQYTPNLTFYAYDLKYKVKTDDSWVRCTFDTMTAVCEKIPNLLYSKPVLRGKLDSILAFDVENFQTTIPAQLGLGDYPLINNWAEGLVVRNVGFGSAGLEDFMFKWKAAKFQEIRHKDQIFEDPLAAERAIALKKVGAQLPRAETVFPKKEQCEAVQLLLDHIVKARLDNLISKIGPEPLLKGEETPASLAKQLAKDALKDFLKDKADYSIVNIPLVYRREMSLRCLFEARLLVNKEWDSIVKGFAADNAKAAAPSPAK